MASYELVKLAQDVATVLVQAQALGEVGVVQTLQMALDELLEGLVADRDRLGEGGSELDEVSGL